MTTARSFVIDFSLMFVAILIGRLIARYFLSHPLGFSNFDLAETAIIALIVAFVRRFIGRKKRA